MACGADSGSTRSWVLLSLRWSLDEVYEEAVAWTRMSWAAARLCEAVAVAHWDLEAAGAPRAQRGRLLQEQLRRLPVHPAGLPEAVPRKRRGPDGQVPEAQLHGRVRGRGLPNPRSTSLGRAERVCTLCCSPCRAGRRFVVWAHASACCCVVSRRARAGVQGQVCMCSKPQT